MSDPYPKAKSAKDQHGTKIVRGDIISLIPDVHVTVVDIWRQGADGTILRTDPAPDPEFGHHFSCRASRVVKI
jgi:hypothetical protein